MTIKDLSTKLHNLSVAGYFNGEQFTVSELEQYIYNCFRSNRKYFIMEIALLDRRTLFKIYRHSNEPDGFDYFIPDTSEGDIALWNQLVSGR